MTKYSEGDVMRFTDGNWQMGDDEDEGDAVALGSLARVASFEPGEFEEGKVRLEHADGVSHGTAYYLAKCSEVVGRDVPWAKGQIRVGTIADIRHTECEFETLDDDPQGLLRVTDPMKTDLSLGSTWNWSKEYVSYVVSQPKLVVAPRHPQNGDVWKSKYNHSSWEFNGKIENGKYVARVLPTGGNIQLTDWAGLQQQYDFVSYGHIPLNETKQSDAATRDWSKWIPPRELPDTGPKEVKVGQVWAWKYRDEVLGVVRITDENLSGRRQERLAGSWETLKDIGFSKEWLARAVLVQDVGQEKPWSPGVLYAGIDENDRPVLCIGCLGSKQGNERMCDKCFEADRIRPDGGAWDEWDRYRDQQRKVPAVFEEAQQKPQEAPGHRLPQVGDVWLRYDGVEVEIVSAGAPDCCDRHVRYRDSARGGAENGHCAGAWNGVQYRFVRAATQVDYNAEARKSPFWTGIES